MREVSCRILDGFFRELPKKNLSAELLARDTGYPVAHLQNKNERIEWTAFLTLAKNCEQIWTEEELVQIGGAWIDSPLFRHVWLITQTIVSPKQLYLRVLSLGVQQFSCISASVRELGPNKVLLEQELADGYEPCRCFFLLTKGGLSQMTKLVGLKPAHVEMSLTPRGALYSITLPSPGGPLVFFRNALKWLTAPRAAALEIDEAHQALANRVMDLEAAQDRLHAQATQLQTAHAIGLVVHAEVDLERTMQAVADAFTSIAHFSGARVSLDGEPAWEAHSGDVDKSPNLSRVLEAHGSVIGRVDLWFGDGAEASERGELVNTVAPIVAMALHSACAYAELLDTQQHLERRVEERTETLAKTNEELKASQEARSRIFSNVNHEIRTPLTLILLTLEALRGSGKSASTPEQALSALERNVRKLLRLVNGLLMVAAHEEEKLVIVPRRTDVSGVITEVVDGFTAFARSGQLVLRTEAEPGVIAEVDPGVLDVMLSNLVSNAIKFTPPGGEVVVELKTRGEEVEIGVRDNGVGISEEFLTRIFGRFEQDARPVRPGAPGSGIGLSIVREMAEAHLGRAEVERLSPGVRFRLILPRIAALKIRRAETDDPRVHRSVPSDFGLSTGDHATTPAVVGRGTQTILVVEDDVDLRILLTNILADHYHVIAVGDAETALALAEKHHPDMMVSDIGLPGLDGLELTRRFRALPGHRMAPVLLLTAYATLEERLSGFEAGAVDYLVKPFQPSELLARTRAQLDQRQLFLQLHESEKLIALGTMSAGLAHEMRNPANGLVNAVEPLIELLPPELRQPDSPVGQLISVIRDCGTQIGLLSRQLLGFRTGEVASEVILVARLVERALAILQSSLRDLQVRLDLRYQGEITCAPALVLQVLTNLIENGIYAAGPHGWISITTYHDEGRLIWEFGDSGPGVPATLRERVFEPFFTTKPAGRGTGLGLSTSRQIAEQHQGTLYVHPTDTGSVFRLEIPLSNAASGTVASG